MSSGIKVRQPLASIKYQTKSKQPLPKEFEAIIASELNIKTVTHQDKGLPEGATDVEIDANITPELKIEGLARELERAVQEMRKKAGLKVGELVNLSYDTSDEELRLAIGLLDRKKTFLKDISAQSSGQMEAMQVDGKAISLSLAK
jgi:isoleucyl-tRNA synthetase